MARVPASNKRQVDIDVEQFMAQFAVMLVDAGVTSARFQDITQHAYFQAAIDRAKFRNNRTNHSAVAALTGLTRVQVRALAKNSNRRKQTKFSNIEKLVWGWTTDKDFISPNLLPQPLTLKGRKSRFSLLVKKHCGDVSSQSILQEMIRTDQVRVKNDTAHLKERSAQHIGEVRLGQLSHLLARIVGQPVARPAKMHPIRTVLREIEYPAVSTKGRTILRKQSIQGLTTFLADIEAAAHAAAIESPPERTRAGLRTRTKVIVLDEEIEQ